MTATTATIHRLGYLPPAWLIDSVDLCFDLDPSKTRVLNTMRVRRNPDSAERDAPLILQGEAISLARVQVDGAGHSFRTEDDDQRLILEQLPDACELQIFTLCKPDQNTELSGLYISQGNFITQCEAEGFRRITYFLDRPDIMASYSVTLRADPVAYPVLLSNGNLVEQGQLPDGRHFARWHDPHKKPSYLFALVAGQLVCREQRIRSKNGHDHLLQIYVRPGDLDQTEFALQSLIAALAWDEARFGLSLDLERFMIVATSDFNMGAMENKGLNIFNTKYVLAKPSTATDDDFFAIESVIAHEYFHNWTGNRVTCRDWFQLSLKEGLTVFRDQEFSQDMAGSPSAASVRRIADVRVLRSVQFAEDAGPMAHPVRPDAYQAIDNFYTATIYEKGAELVRMYQTLLGQDGFRQGLALYFQRHDGQAVTCDDFAQAMADANPGSSLAQHLELFKRWYAQAGTPHLHASGHYDAAAQSYTLTLRQHTPAPPGQPDKLPLLIPVRMGLLDDQGADLPLQLQGEAQPVGHERVLVLTAAEHSYTFIGLSHAPTPSLLRGFSAPVILDSTLSATQQRLLLLHDSDPFNRWEAGQQLLTQAALAAYHAHTANPETDAALAAPIDDELLHALNSCLQDQRLDPAFRAMLLTLPAENYLAEQLPRLQPGQLHAVREAMRRQIASQLQPTWQQLWQQYGSSHHAYRPTAEQAGPRSLANLAMQYLSLHAVAHNDRNTQGKILQRYKDASNMTERWGALLALSHSASPLADAAIQRFYSQYADQALVIDKWFTLQASQPQAGRSASILAQVQQLMRHPAFTHKNPNRVRSLIFAYCNNAAAFHLADGSGYRFWAEQVLTLDRSNSQTAARLARMLERWSRLEEPQRSQAQAAIAQVLSHDSLSSDVREVLERAQA